MLPAFELECAELVDSNAQNGEEVFVLCLVWCLSLSVVTRPGNEVGERPRTFSEDMVDV